MPTFQLEKGRLPLLAVPPRLYLKGGNNSPTGNYGSVIRRDGEQMPSV